MGGCWQVSALLGALVLAACVSDGGKPAPSPPTAATVPAPPAPLAAVTAPDAPAPVPTAASATAIAAGVSRSARIPPGEAMDEAVAAGEMAARDATAQGLAALQGAAAPAFQGGTLSGPLGSLDLAPGADGTRATVRLEPAAGIGVTLRQEPDVAGARVDLGPGMRIEAESVADRNRLAAAMEIARGLSVASASDGDMRRDTVAWRITRQAQLSGNLSDGGASRGMDLRLMDRFGFSVSEEENERRQRVSVDMAPGLTVETSRALSWGGREEDDRIGVKWMLRY